MKPFQTEEESMTIGALTVENRIDRVALYGSIDLTRDKGGLGQARILRDLLEQVVTALENEDLPDRIELASTDTIENPFTDTAS